MLKFGSALALLSTAHCNILSPGLDKCLQTIARDDVVNVEVTTCTDNTNQHFQIQGGSIKSQDAPAGSTGMCLTAEKAEANSNVHLQACDDALASLQKWKLTHYGNVLLTGTELCLDIKAGLKADGTRETWNEIKQHDVVNVHLYTCHDPETTDRVNQLWTWAPFKNGQQVTAKSAPAATTAAPAASTAAPAATTAASAATNGASDLAVTAAPAATADGVSPTASASMPNNVDAALALQGVVQNNEKGAVLFMNSHGAIIAAGGVGLTSLVVMLVGLYRWSRGEILTMNDEEMEALDTEKNVM